jgi:hypothetical protein
MTLHQAVIAAAAISPKLLLLMIAFIWKPFGRIAG